MVVVNLLSLQSPFQVEAWRLAVFVLHPSSLFESAFYITIATLDNENFGILFNPVLLLPLFEVSNFEEHLLNLHIAL